jgi:hypothetical protein
LKTLGSSIGGDATKPLQERRRQGRAALAAVAGALVLASAPDAFAERAVGIDWAGPASRIGWFDPATMTLMRGRTAALGSHVGSWSRSPDGWRLAIARSGGVDVRFVDLITMRTTGDLALAPGGRSLGGVTWTRPDRLLAFVDRPQNAWLVVADPQRRRVVRRTSLDAVVSAYDRSAGGLVLLLAPPGRIGPARLLVVDAAGTARSVLVDQVPVGFDYGPTGGPTAQRRAGLAVDFAGATAYVVDADRVAVVDLASLAVAYRTDVRQLAKAIPGPYRAARWLGNGVIAVSGNDGYGVRLLDVRSWTLRTLDPAAETFQLASGFVVAGGVAYRVDGSVRFPVAVPPGAWLNARGGRYAPVCVARRLVAVLDLQTGLQHASPKGRCADLLIGRSSAG